MEKSNQVKAALGIMRAIAETIKELGEVPSGHLYAQLMDKMSLESFLGIINTLKRSGVITENNNLLKWAIK